MSCLLRSRPNNLRHSRKPRSPMRFPALSRLPSSRVSLTRSRRRSIHNQLPFTRPRVPRKALMDLPWVIFLNRNLTPPASTASAATMKASRPTRIIKTCLSIGLSRLLVGVVEVAAETGWAAMDVDLQVDQGNSLLPDRVDSLSCLPHSLRLIKMTRWPP